MAVKKETVRYTKAQILSADRYRHETDFVSALLDEDKTYSLSEVDALISDYMKGSVK